MTLRHATAVTAALATVLVACTACGHNTDAPASPPTPSHRPSLDLSHAEGAPVPYDEAVKTYATLMENIYQIHKQGTFTPDGPVPKELSDYSQGEALKKHSTSLNILAKNKIGWRSGKYRISNIHQIPTPSNHPKGTTLQACEDWRGLTNVRNGKESHGLATIFRSTYQYTTDGKVKQVYFDGADVESCK